MEGQAVVDLEGKDYNQGQGTLAMLLRDPAKAPLFKHLKDAQGKWTVREDVWVRYQRTWTAAGRAAWDRLHSLRRPASFRAGAAVWTHPR